MIRRSQKKTTNFANGCDGGSGRNQIISNSSDGAQAYVVANLEAHVQAASNDEATKHGIQGSQCLNQKYIKNYHIRRRDSGTYDTGSATWTSGAPSAALHCDLVASTDLYSLQAPPRCVGIKVHKKLPHPPERF